jgi:hypothetical protein
MADTMTFGELLDAANESKTGRGPGQWTPAACKAWREAEPEMARMLEAAYAWELGSHRIARAEDEAAVRAVWAAMDEATAAARGKAAG